MTDQVLAAIFRRLIHGAVSEGYFWVDDEDPRMGIETGLSLTLEEAALIAEIAAQAEQPEKHDSWMSVASPAAATYAFILTIESGSDAFKL